MFLDAGDFFIKLDEFNKKIKSAQQELSMLSYNLGKSMKKSELNDIKEITSKVSQIYHELGKYYNQVKVEYAKIEKQMAKVNLRVENMKRELREREEEMKTLRKAVETYEGSIFIYSIYTSEIYNKMSLTLQDFSDFIGRVEALSKIISGFSGSQKKEIKELQRSLSETDRYIW